MAADSIDVNFGTTPVFYTDNVNIVANKDGVVLNVIQRFGGRKKVVSRIGMSREHARDLVDKLGRLLVMSDRGKKSLN